MRRRYMLSGGISVPNVYSGDYYVSENGTGTGFIPSDPMSVADFSLVTLAQFNRIFFKRGDTIVWPEYDITVGDVTIDAFGSGADPVLIGSDSYTAATWTSETGGYYSTPLATAPLWVTKNGECARQGETDWIPTTADSTATGITALAATLNAFNSVEALANNAKLRIKEFNFRLSYEHLVTAYNTGSGVMTIGAGGVVGGSSGHPFKLYGQKQYATLEGDWWYDDANNKLWIKTASTPAGTDIRVITQNYAFNVQASNVTIQNIDFTQYYETSVDAPAAPNIIVQNVSIHDNRTNGIMFYGNTTTFTFTNYTIERIGLNAIHIGAVGSGNMTSGTNTIDEIGEQANIGWPFDTYWIKTGGCAVACFWDSGETIKQPTNVDATGINMSNLGYMGMLMIGDGHNITECVCHDFCTKWNDGGGFYTIHRATLGSSTKNVIFLRCVAYNGIGNIDGIAGAALSPQHAEGLYADNGSELITFQECISYDNSDIGILSNWDTRKTSIIDCVVYGNQNSQVIFKQDTDPADSPVFTTNISNVLTGNVIVAQDVGFCVENINRSGELNYNPFSGAGGDSNNNIYVKPYGTNVCASRVSATGVQTLYTLAAWKTYISDDAATTSVVESSYIYKNPIKSRTDVKLAVNATGTATTFNGTGYHDIAGTPLGSSESLPAWSAIPYLITTQTTPNYLLDTFTAANGTAIAGRAPAVGPTPTIGAGTHTITSNEMVSSVNGTVFWDIAQSNFDFTVSTRDTAISAGLNTYFRYVDTNNRFTLAFSSTQVQLFERIAAVNVNTWTYTQSFFNSQQIRISVRANGTNVKVWVNGYLAFDVTVTHTSSGSVGFLGGTGRASDNLMAEAV